jgi:adenine-specific DNA-methyltransferase
LNANFGVPLKKFLVDGGYLRRLVYFSHAELIFDDALTTACLLYLERPERPQRLAEIETWFVPPGTRPDDNTTVRRRLPVAALPAEGKWSWPIEHGVSSARIGAVPLSQLATTRRGIATGANRFFHLAAGEARQRGVAAEHLTACLGRAASIRGLIVDNAAFEQMRDAGKPCYLLRLPATGLNPAERRYVAEGEAQGLPQRFLLAARTPWYAMEKRPPAPILAAVFGRSQFRFLWNTAAIENLTAFHCVYPHDDDPLRIAALVACLNSTSVQHRAGEQRRVYGGGLLKFEPKDLLDVEVPDVRQFTKKQCRQCRDRLQALDRAIKSQELPRQQQAQAELDRCAAELD